MGIIPARAGFTPRGSAGSPSRTDHPRSRGVYLENGRQRPVYAGSSPLARGLPQTEYRNPATIRIIPARAGFTCLTSVRSCGGRDHPRSRGVYTSILVAVRCVWGSSPLARGLPRPRLHGRHRHGIIPARAGFTPEGRR